MYDKAEASKLNKKCVWKNEGFYCESSSLPGLRIKSL